MERPGRTGPIRLPCAAVAIARQRITLPPGSLRDALLGLAGGRLWDGPEIERFEQAFARFIGVPAAVAVPSGRAGLRFALEALQLEPGAEVICSAFGYPVVPWVAKSLGLGVRFADCELETLGMDPGALSRVISDRTQVVITTHLYGVPCRIREIAALAEQHGAALIEDCAHCLGAAVAGRKAGAWGQAAYFSFETSKPLNTLGGGMITLTDAALEKRVRDLAGAQPRHETTWLAKRLAKTTFEAIATHPLTFNLAAYPLLRLLQRGQDTAERFVSGYHADEVTIQGRLGRYSNYQARLGLRQLEKIEPSLARRARHAERLVARLGSRLDFQSPEADAEANYMLATARVPDLGRFTAALLRLGVDSKHHYMRDCSAIADSGESFPNAARAEREVLHLPAYPQLSDGAVDRVAAAVERVAAEAGTTS